MKCATERPRRATLFGGSSSRFLGDKLRALNKAGAATATAARPSSSSSTAANRQLLSRSTPVLSSNPFDLSSADFSIELSERSNDDLSALLTSQLHDVRQDKDITRLKLNNFVHRCDQPSFVVIKTLLLGDSRPWRSIKFADTVQGNEYRRWLYKKESLCRRIVTLEDELGIAIKFNTRLEVALESMCKQSIVDLLETVRQDAEVTTLSFTGAINLEDVEDIYNALAKLMRHEPRRKWDGIIFHVSYTGGSADYTMWHNTIRKYSLRLEKLSAECSIPIGFKMIN